MKAIFFFLLLMGSDLVAQPVVSDTLAPNTGKFSFSGFGDYAIKVHGDSLHRNTTNYYTQQNNYSVFDIRRIYLGYDYAFDKRFSAEILLSHEGNTDAADNRTLFVKLANVRWKNIFKYTDLVMGDMATPSFAYMERLWGYRSVEKTITDMRAISISNDVGVALKGLFDSSGKSGYTVMIGNGRGQKPENNPFKKFYANWFTKAFNRHLVIDVNADYERVKQETGRSFSKATYKLGLAYQQPLYTIGVEGFAQLEHNLGIAQKPGSLVFDAVDLTTCGLSLFARGSLQSNNINFFIRYDYFNPDKSFHTDYIYGGNYAFFTENFMTAGVDFVLSKNVHIMPNVWVNSYHDQRSGAAIPGNSTDVVGRCTLNINFNR